MKKEAFAIVVMVFISLSFVLIPQARAQPKFIIASWSYPDDYGQGIEAITDISQYSGGSWIDVNGAWETIGEATYNITDGEGSNGTIRIDFKCWLNNTIIGAENLTDALNYLNLSLTVTSPSNSSVSYTEDYSIIWMYDTYAPLYYYKFRMTTDFTPQSSTIYTARLAFIVGEGQFMYGWTKQKTYSITSANDVPAGYQIPVNVSYDADMQADFDDLRFFDDDGITLLPAWLESKVASSWAYIWVKIADALTTGSHDFIVRYGSPTANNYWDGDTTFEFFDDFNDASLDLSKWTIYTDYGSEYSQTGGLLVLQPSANSIMIGSDTSFAPQPLQPQGDLGFALAMNVFFQDCRIWGFCESVGNSTLSLDDCAIFEDFSTTERQRTSNEGAGTLHSNAVAENTWQQNKVYWWSSSHVEFYVNDIELDDHTTNIPDGTPPLRVTFYVYNADPNPDMRIDWVYVRQLVGTIEPYVYYVTAESNFTDTPPTYVTVNDIDFVFWVPISAATIWAMNSYYILGGALMVVFSSSYAAYKIKNHSGELSDVAIFAILFLVGWALIIGTVM